MNDQKLAESFFDYSTKENRQETVQFCHAIAKNARNGYERKWKSYDEIYRNLRRTIDTDNEVTEHEDGQAILNEAFIQVESQIDPTVPEPEFRGRDAKMDKDKAKQREFAVKYVIQRNDLESQNTVAERYLNKYGDAFWKVYWDEDIQNPNSPPGDVVVKAIPIDDIFPDPSAKNIDDCEFVQYVYYMHVQKLKRIYGKALAKADLGSSPTPATTQAVSREDNSPTDTEFLQQVIEHWYKDDDGDICLSICVNGVEIKSVEKYWDKTGVQNKLYPFVHYWKIRNEASFWNTSEIEVILPALKKADKALALGLLNMEYTSNDITVVEEGALLHGADAIDSSPGSVLVVANEKINKVKRLGGMRTIDNFIPVVQFFQEEMQRSTRNYDSNQGKETQRVTTASGLAQLRADAAAQNSIKSYDRNNGFKRLFELIDWTVLEFYDEPRYIYIGTPGNDDKAPALGNLDPLQGAVYYRFDSNDAKVETEGMVGEGGETESYYPRIDVTVNAGDGIIKSKAFTAQVLEQLLAVQLTPDNYRIALALLEILDIPQKQEISTMWKNKFEAMQAQEQARMAQQAHMMQQPLTDDIIATLPPQLQQAARNRPDLVKAALMQSEQAIPGQPV